MERKQTAGSAHLTEQKAATKQAFTKFSFTDVTEKAFPTSRSKSPCGEILTKVLHKSKPGCLSISHNSRWKRAEKTFFISINNMLLFICVKRFTESFILALDHSGWQYKHRNSINTENKRERKMAVQSYWDSSNHSNWASHRLDIVSWFLTL